MAYEGSVVCTVVRRAVTNWILLHRFNAGCFCSGSELIVALYIKGDDHSVHRTPLATSSFHHTHTYTYIHTVNEEKWGPCPKGNLDNGLKINHTDEKVPQSGAICPCERDVTEGFNFFALFSDSFPWLNPTTTPTPPPQQPHPQSNPLAYIWGIHRTH